MPNYDDPGPASPTPASILIIGAGVFGLSTALSLLSRPRYKTTKITILDAAQQLPNPSGSSVDASRIVRADYAVTAYAKLAVEAQRGWRGEEEKDKKKNKNNESEPSSDTGKGNVQHDQDDDDCWGGQGRYQEPGFVLTCEADQEMYVRKALENVSALASAGVRGIEMDKIQCFEGLKEIRKATGYEDQTGKWGYANWNSGWADAEKCVEWALERVKRLGGEDRVEIRSGVLVDHLIVLSDPGEEGVGGRGRRKRKCLGAHLTTGEKIHADLTIVAAGAWSSTFIDLRRRCVATGQALSYIDISEEEQRQLEGRPTIMNMSQGIFIIPPRGRELKVARHGFGYRNPEKVKRSKLVMMMDVVGDKISNGQNPEDEFVEISIPKVGIPIPPEGQEACREAMKELIPDMADRPFSRTRVCWYCDTPTGDFLITYPPLSSPTTTSQEEEHDNKSLFIATGGSGHGFKFFPVIGDKIVDAIEGSLDPELAELWRWRTDEELNELLGGHDKEFVVCEDGSRAGRRGMVLAEEMARDD